MLDQLRLSPWAKIVFVVTELMFATQNILLSVTL